MPITVFFVGAPQIGKTEILNTLTQNKSADIGPTIGVEMRNWSHNSDGNVNQFHIWDISGKTFYANLMMTSIQGGQITVVCYDTRNASFFNNIKRWITIVEQSPYPQSLILYGIIHDYEERQIMPSDALLIAEHVRHRRNCKSVHCIEGRISDRCPLFECITSVAKLHVRTYLNTQQ